MKFGVLNKMGYNDNWRYKIVEVSTDKIIIHTGKKMIFKNSETAKQFLIKFKSDHTMPKMVVVCFLDK